MLTYVGEDVEKQEPSHIAGGNVTWYSHLEKFVKKLNINLLYKPTIPLRFLLKEMKTMPTKNPCRSMPIETLCIIAKKEATHVQL